jgi:DNA helicase-2/ATP-dependent DNA helicase PcrA
LTDTQEAPSIEDVWWNDRHHLLKSGLGFVAYRTDRPPLVGRHPDFECLAIGDEIAPDSEPQALVLPHLSRELLHDPDHVGRIKRSVKEALRSNVALLVSTSLTEGGFVGSLATSDASPWELDVGALLAGDDLVLAIESCCIARAVTQGDARYLTPIEARLARALDQSAISFRRQAWVGAYCVDFLFQSGLIVECDGARYHDASRDAVRDEELRRRGHSVLRLTGRHIIRDTADCVRRIESALSVSSDEADASADLTERQARAVAHGAGPARVSAPAGSGKTRVVKHRVERLIADGVHPSRICAISFTNKAVDEMRSRLPDAANDGTRFTTIHSLAKEISESPPLGARKENLQTARSRWSPTRWTVVKGLLKPDEAAVWGARDLWLDTIASFRQGFRVPDLSDFPTAARPTEERILEVHAAYDGVLRAKGYTDFEGYIIDAIRVLARSAETRRLWSSKFDYWIVDEYQDLPAGKLSLLRLLTAPGNDLFVVGDDDQILYGFCGASTKGFGTFPDLFAGTTDYVLGENFRCAHEIVVRTSWLIERNVDRVSKPLEPHKALVPADVVRFGDEGAYAAEAVEFVRHEQRRGVPLDEVALLFRIKDFAVPVERALQAAEIPFIRCSTGSFFQRSVVKGARAWLRIFGSHATNKDVDHALRWPWRYLKRQHLDLVLSQLARNESIDAATASSAARLAANRIEDPQKQHALEDWATRIEAIPTGVPPADALTLLGLRTALEEAQPDPGESSPLALFDVFLRLCTEFRSTPELEQWIATYGVDPDYSFEDQPADGVGTRLGYVTLSSIHQAKGREFHSVGVLGPQDGMPDSRALTYAALEEERRIAYVAATRASESLLWAASRQYARELCESVDGLTWDEYRSTRCG